MKIAIVCVGLLSFGLFGLSPASAKPANGVSRDAATAGTLAAKKRAFFAMIRAYNNAVKLGCSGKLPKSCRFKGKKLWGKVQVVNSFPDFKVKKVSSFPDLKVQVVSSFPDKCGKWQFVKSFPSFKIQWVKSFPDFTIKIVRNFPGVR